MYNISDNFFPIHFGYQLFYTERDISEKAISKKYVHQLLIISCIREASIRCRRLSILDHLGKHFVGQWISY